MVIRVELSTGEPISESPNFKLVEGSHSTKLTVRCDGSRVKITGNASRFHRIDNLFGLETIDDCIKVYNQVLASVDLPPFTKCTQVKYRQGEEGGKVQLVTDGAGRVIIRCHLVQKMPFFVASLASPLVEGKRLISM